jgi:prolyl-tRNA synthetase
MRQSQLFTKTRREAPKDEVSKNAQLLIRAGYVHKEMAGVYDFLPLGLRVLDNIKKIVREEMDALGGQELLMTALQRKELWEQTNRWDDAAVDVWFKSQLRAGGEVGFGWSHEEPITDMMNHFISSHKDLPVYVYQFQTKLRNELRTKSGIMRGREFVMKDMYSYSLTEETHKKFYDEATAAYLRIFERVGLGDRTFLTFASGGAFTQFSHEFQTLSEAGEDTVYIDRAKKIAVNKEVLSPEILEQLELTKEELEEAKTIEVGNIFSFGDTKSRQLGLRYRDERGEERPVILGSYGIGITRLMGTLVEVYADEGGLVWPESVSPFAVHLIELSGGSREVKEEAEELYRALSEAKVEVLYDDRDARAGEKFADSDLLGVPLRIIVSQKSLTEGTFECVERRSGHISHKGVSEILSQLAHV